MSALPPGSTELVSSPCLQGERVTFTGTLASMTHRQACELVERHGGVATGHVSRQTTMLVVGEEGWPLEEDGGTSAKLDQSIELMRQGVPLQLLKESDWLRLLGLEQRDRDIQRLFTPAMLRQKLGIPVGSVRRWERLGLIHAVERVFRLPYFDFQEVVGVRRLQEMLTAGISRERIEASLRALRTLLPSIDRPLAQLEILARDSQVLYRDGRGLVEARGGQRRFDFEPENAQPEDDSIGTTEEQPSVLTALSAKFRRKPQSPGPHRSADDWFDEGARRLDGGEPAQAIEAFRMALMETPDDPELHFHLADALYRTGNLPGALERCHVAVELDHEFIEAWTQLGCLRHESGDLPGALDAFDIALTIHQTYADPLFHKATVLSETGQADEARALWRQYLELQPAGPWSDAARERLEAHCGNPETVD